MKTTLKIAGTHCNSCKMLIEDVCKDFKEVKGCTVDFKTGKTIVEHVPSLDLNALKKEIEVVGKYTVMILG